MSLILFLFYLLSILHFTYYISLFTFYYNNVLTC